MQCLSVIYYVRKDKFSIKSYKMYKHFLTQHLTFYNGKWYCYICNLTLKCLTEAKCHLQAHQNINIQILDPLIDKSFKLSNKKCKKLLHHGIVLKSIPHDYFCLSCNCLIPSLDHADAHSKGKRHQKCIKAIAENSTNVQNSNDNADIKHNDISAKVGTQLKQVNKSNFSAKVQPIFENDLVVSNILNNSKMEEKNTKKSNGSVKPTVFINNIIINKLEEYNINNNKNIIITTANTNSKNNVTWQKESISGFFMSSDIDAEITLINNSSKKLLQAKQRFYKSEKCIKNKMYKKKFLHFEEIIFICNEKKLNEIKSNLQFYVPYFEENNMYCLLCNKMHSYDIHDLYKHIRSMEHVTQFIQLNTNNEQLKLSRELIRIESMHAKCYACDHRIEWMHYNATRIEKHIHSNSHRMNCKQLLKRAEDILKEFKTLWYSIQYYACVICHIRFKMKIEFMEHLDEKHKTVLNTKDDSKFDFCITCATLWYDDRNLTKTYLAHCAKRTHKYLTEHNDFTVTSLPQMLQKLLQNIDKTVADLFKQSKNMLDDPRPNELQNALKQVFEICHLPEVEVCLFGSRFTGLALQNSDIDIYLNFGNECTEAKLIQSRSQKIQNCLQIECEKWEIKSVLNSSRTPIIKVKHRSTGLDCDISFTNSLSLENSKFIKSFNMTYPICQKLILFLKKWLSLGGLAGSSGITNYTLAWLVIFYLQVKHKVPSISALIENHNQSKIVCGWETGIGDTIPDAMKVSQLQMQESKQVHKLLLEFFKYYRSFDYMQYIICPLLGKRYSKESFTEISTLPDSMSRYVTQLQGIKPEYFRIDSPMCVQDPFDLSHNLTKAVPSLILKRFKHYCNESASMLCTIIKNLPKETPNNI